MNINYIPWVWIEPDKLKLIQKYVWQRVLVDYSLWNWVIEWNNYKPKDDSSFYLRENMIWKQFIVFISWVSKLDCWNKWGDLMYYVNDPAFPEERNWWNVDIDMIVKVMPPLECDHMWTSDNRDNRRWDKKLSEPCEHCQKIFDITYQ